MPTRHDAQTVARRLHALAGSEIQRKAAARELATRHPVDANELVDHLMQLARNGWEPASCVLASFVAALKLEADQIPHLAALRRLAAVQCLDSVAGLLATGPPVKELDAREAAKADARMFSESLGHLKQKARATRNPDELARLAAASNPSVVRNVLLNPRLTEATVVRIAARRPARPEPLFEIWKSERWSRRHAVRRALVFNPYLALEIAVKIVPLLNVPDLAELSRDEGVHPELRELARQLLAQSHMAR